MGEQNDRRGERIAFLYQGDRERVLTLEFLRIVNETRGIDELVRAATVLFQSLSGCEAVGVRLQSGHDFPYAETRGFPVEFVSAENELCELDAVGRPKLDNLGNPIRKCMCGNVLFGRFDPKQPFFTERGTFWTNCTTRLSAKTRNRCNDEGYESVALVPLIANGDRIGLVQFNDRQIGRFSASSIEVFEHLADQLAIAIAKARAEVSLAKSERLYRSLFDNMLNGFAYCEMHFEGDVPVDFTYLDTNAAFERLTGLRSVKGKRVSEAIPALRASDPELFEIYGRVARTGVPEAFEKYVAALSMWFSVTVYSPARDHFVAVFDVITARKRAEEELRQSEQRYRMLIENLEEVVYVLDPLGCITYVSEAVSRFGYQPEDLVGTLFEPLVHPADIPKAFQILSDTHSSRKTSRTDIRVLGKGGAVYFVTGSARVLLREGKVIGMIGIVSDVTSHRQMEQHLLRSQRMEAVGRLAGGIAHDFNNLLTVIKSYTTIISEQVVDLESIRPELNEISNATVRAAALTRQLLAFSSRQVIEPQIVNLNHIVQDTGSMLRRLLGADIDLITELDSELGNTKLDAGQFEQVLVNFAINARDAMPHGGTLTLATCNQSIGEAKIATYGLGAPGDYVALSVADTGIGMDEQTQARAFEPFFTTKEAGQGTGLGLATVYGIVRQSDGGILLTSAPGAGTNFMILLPRTEASIDAQLPSMHPRVQSARGETILVAEDDEVVRAATAQTLTLAGYTVIVASNGDEALELYRTHIERIALVVADVVMPRLSGRELSLHLRAINPKVRILFVSGYASDALISGGFDPTNEQLVAKPYRADQLRRKVREMLDLPQ